MAQLGSGLDLLKKLGHELGPKPEKILGWAQVGDGLAQPGPISALLSLLVWFCIFHVYESLVIYITFGSQFSVF